MRLPPTPPSHRLEVPKTPSLSLSYLLEWLREPREAFYFLDFQLIVRDITQGPEGRATQSWACGEGRESLLPWVHRSAHYKPGLWGFGGGFIPRQD